MKRTSALLRGTKGKSWYLDYMQKGKEGFKKTVPPTPFDWTLPSTAGDSTIKRTKAFFDVSIGQALVGRLTFELADDIVPTTVKNFSLLCTGSNIHERSFKGTKFFNILKGSFIMGGDVELNDGTGSYSAYKERYIEDENFIIPHTHRGLLSMASVGVNTSGSQFYLSLNPCPHMDGRCVVFGRMIDPQSEATLQSIEKVFTFRGMPSNEILIADCGII